MNILITGGLGFIGSVFAEKLSANKKNKLTVIDNYSGYSSSGNKLMKDISSGY